MNPFLLPLAVLACSGSTLLAQPFAVSRSTIDGGSGTITAGSYSLRGTVGQPDAVPPIASGTYELAAGFWPGITAAAPSCPADTNGDGILDNGDIGTFVSLFLAGDSAADFNGDGILDNGDIGAFVAAFLAGC